MHNGRVKFLGKGGLRGRARVVENYSRGDAVAAQYNIADAATGYAEAHEGSGSTARFFRSRIHLISQALTVSPGGDLLDVGCGPGMMVRQLLDSRPGDFRITALDPSPVMVEACARRAGEATDVSTLVGRVEAMPFTNDSFDVVLAMGALEYAELTAALDEIVRVTRPGGLVLVTMLNPASPYRFVEWHIYWPLLRVLSAVETRLNLRSSKRHGPGETGIRAYRKGALRRRMDAVGLRPVETIAFDVTLLVPPLDRVVRRLARGWQKKSTRTGSRRWHMWLGTAYLVVAHKAMAPADDSRLRSR